MITLRPQGIVGELPEVGVTRRMGLDVDSGTPERFDLSPVQHLKQRCGRRLACPAIRHSHDASREK